MDDSLGSMSVDNLLYSQRTEQRGNLLAVRSIVAARVLDVVQFQLPGALAPEIAVVEQFSRTAERGLKAVRIVVVERQSALLAEPLQIHVERLALMESHLGPRGATYAPLFEIRLGR